MVKIEPKSDLSSGCANTPLSTQAPSCPPHRWRLGTTAHDRIPSEGLTNMGVTTGVCSECGATREWRAPTPDNVHGMDSHILAEMAGDDLSDFQGEEPGYDTED